MKYFKTWLIDEYFKIDNYLGDLARDIKNDKDFPRTNNKYKIYDYLENRGACKECLDTFGEAYIEYEVYRTCEEISVLFKKERELKFKDKDTWEKIINRVEGDKKLSVAALLRKAKCRIIKENKLYIVFPNNFTFATSRLSSKETKEYLLNVIRETTNTSIQEIEITVDNVF